MHAGERLAIPESATPPDAPASMGDRYQARFDGEGHGARVETGDEASAHERGFTWVHVRRDAPGVLDWLSAHADLDDVVRAALTREDTRPGCTPHEDGVILNLRGVNLTPGAEPEDMISVRLWVSERLILGVWLRPLKAVGDIVRGVERGQGPRTPGEFAARLALRLIDRAEPVVAQLNEQVDDLEEALLDEARAPDRATLVNIRRRAIAGSLGPQKAWFPR